MFKQLALALEYQKAYTAPAQNTFYANKLDPVSYKLITEQTFIYARFKKMHNLQSNDISAEQFCCGNIFTVLCGLNNK